jgi:tRNA(fMet)-specific endonuclease VapC
MEFRDGQEAFPDGVWERGKGTPIPENDVWIAAVTLECAMPLATRDAYFGHVTGLQLLRW